MVRHPEKEHGRIEALREQFHSDVIETPLDQVLPDSFLNTLSKEEKFNTLLRMINGGRNFELGRTQEVPSFDQFTRWLTDTVADNEILADVQEDQQELVYRYKAYLAYKANFELLKRYLEKKGMDEDVVPSDAQTVEEIDLDEVPTKVLEQYYAKTASGRRRPTRFIGFYTSPTEIRGSEIKMGSASEDFSSVEDLLAGKESDRIDTGWTFYSLDPDHLYPGGNFMYLVEGNSAHVQEALDRDNEGAYRYDPSTQWVGVHQALRVIGSVPLDGDTRRRYGLHDVSGAVSGQIAAK